MAKVEVQAQLATDIQSIAKGEIASLKPGEYIIHVE